MEKADVEQSSGAVTADAEKHAEIDHAASDAPAKEQEQQQAKARPRRIASFKDYVVRLGNAVDDSFDLSVENADGRLICSLYTASLPIRNEMGLSRLRCGRPGLDWRRHHVATDECRLWYVFLLGNIADALCVA